MHKLLIASDSGSRCTLSICLMLFLCSTIALEYQPLMYIVAYAESSSTRWSNNLIDQNCHSEHIISMKPSVVKSRAWTHLRSHETAFTMLYEFMQYCKLYLFFIHISIQNVYLRKYIHTLRRYTEIGLSMGAYTEKKTYSFKVLRVGLCLDSTVVLKACINSLIETDDRRSLLISYNCLIYCVLYTSTTRLRLPSSIDVGTSICTSKKNRYSASNSMKHWKNGRTVALNV